MGAAGGDDQGRIAVSVCALFFFFRVVVGVLWWGLVEAKAGTFLSVVVWDLALRLADFFLRHPEVLCLF